MNRRRWILTGIFILAAALLAFLLQDLIESFLLKPLSYVWFALTILYRLIAQLVLWGITLLVVAWLAFSSLYGRFRWKRSPASGHNFRRGQVQAMVENLGKLKQGRYYQWMVANRLGNLARSLLRLREGQDAFPAGSQLSGRGWAPPASVVNYLDAGLNNSFADFSERRCFFSPQVKTPLDADVWQVVDYLEKQIGDKQ
ncbi:MAG: hypothetical protein JXA13_12225 [Anaerolineales bacterium]|nr:hypothetical protein [Anaerolineales bacterium]